MANGTAEKIDPGTQNTCEPDDVSQSLANEVITLTCGT